MIGARTVLGMLLAVQVVLALIAGGRARANRDNDPILPDSNSDQAAVTRPLTIESGIQLGQQQASTWLPGAKVLNVNMQIDWPTSPPDETVTTLPPGGWVTVTFVAPWDHDEAEAATLTLFFDRGSGQLFGQSQTEWSNAPHASISLSEASVDSTTAVVAAELAGGTSFRAECPETRTRTRVNLVAQTTGNSGDESGQVWLISYTDSRNRFAGYRVSVDAQSGDIVSIEDDRVEC
jgi:hypothetical protein